MSDEWTDIYDKIVRLIGANIVYISDKVKCYVKDRLSGKLYQPMNVEKLRFYYQFYGMDEEPKDEIWVTVNDGMSMMRTISIPRKSEGIDTEIKDVTEVFKNIIKLFTYTNNNEDEQWANAPQEE